MTDRSTSDLLAEAVALLTAYARGEGYVVPDEPTDVEQLLLLARSIRYGWRPSPSPAATPPR